MSDPERLLVLRGNGSSVWHYPSDADPTEPACDAAEARDATEASDPAYKQLRPEIARDWYELCSFCSRDAGDEEIGANGGIEPCHRCGTDLLVQRSSTDHDFWCHGCGKHFGAGDRSGTAVPLPDGGHPPGCSPESSTADSSPDGEWFVLDEARTAVIDGPLPMARAKTLANEYSPDHIAIARSAIELLENASSATVRWETDDVDVVTDGGKSVSEADLARLSNISVREVAIRDGDDEEVAWKATVENDSSVPDCRGDTATEAIDVLLEFLWGSEHTSPFADDGGSR